MKACLVVVRGVATLHSAHGVVPDLLHKVLAQIIRKRMDFAQAVAHEVNVVRPNLVALAPGNEVHLDDIGDSQVIAAHHFNVLKRWPPRFPHLVAVQKTFSLARLRVHGITLADVLTSII